MAKSSRRKKTASAAPRAEKEEAVTISKTAIWQIISGVLAIVIVVLLVTGSWGTQTGVAPTPTPTQPAQPGQQPAGEVQVNLDGVRSIGAEDAPVVIVEYSDFTCPFCKRFHDETLGLIKQNYVDSGQVRFVYKDFPVVGGQRPAEAGWCAHEQGEFWAFHDKIFEDPRQATDANMIAWAGDLGLDQDAFTECLTSGRYQANVAQERQEAINNGIRGTPGFLVNGQLVSGAQPYSIFEQAINAALN